MRSAYKELRNALSKKFKTQLTNGHEYDIVENVYAWVRQSGLKPTIEHFKIISVINDGVVPYPYQKSDRKRVLDYLRDNNYKSFQKKYFDQLNDTFNEWWLLQQI